MVISSPCLTDIKNWLVQGKRLCSASYIVSTGRRIIIERICIIFIRVLDFEEVKSAFEEVNTGGIKVSDGIEEINAGSLDVNTGIDPVTTDSIRVSVPSPDRGRREGKAPMTEEEETQASRKTKEQILQEEAGLAEAIRLDALEKALEKERIRRGKQVHLDFTSSLKGWLKSKN
ncbi:hypothetical protein Tco_1515977 [Tanacetum coccineum]